MSVLAPPFLKLSFQRYLMNRIARFATAPAVARAGTAPAGRQTAPPEVLPAVVARDLHKAYRHVRAVNGISLTVNCGEIVGLLGPNGAGKTTTLEMILGLRRPDAGTVRILGEAVSPRNPRYKRLIGAQLQRTEFPETWTVREVLELFATFYPRPIPPEELLERFGLREKRNALVKTLSGGQLRRLGLAAALIGRPRVVCLDEPTSGLDAHARRILWDLIAELRQSGLTLLLTTHSMEEAERLCDRVAIIDEGRILAADTPRRLIREQFPERAVEFEVAEVLEPALLERLPAISRAQAGPGGRYTLFTEDPILALASLLGWAEESGLVLDDVHIRSATLEDVFLRLTGRRILA